MITSFFIYYYRQRTPTTVCFDIYLYYIHTFGIVIEPIFRPSMVEMAKSQQQQQNITFADTNTVNKHH